MKALPRIVIDTDEEFVLEIKGKTISSELIVGVQAIRYDILLGKSDVKLIVTNPNSITEGVIEITYNNLNV